MPGQLIPSAGGGSIDEGQVQTVVETAIASILPEGGTTAQMLVKASDDDLDFTYADPVGSVASVRVWEAASLLYLQDFTGGVPDAPWTVPATATAEVAPTVASTTPTPYTTVLRYANLNGTRTLSLDLNALEELDGFTPIQIKFWVAQRRGNVGGNPVNFSFYDGATLRHASGNTSISSSVAWAEHTYTIGSVDNDPTWVVNHGTSADFWLTGVRIYANAAPYMLNEIVRYNGEFYRSLLNNNPNQPDSLVGWQEV